MATETNCPACCATAVQYSCRKINCNTWICIQTDTNDTRESPAIRIALELLEEGAEIAIHDPKVSEARITQDLGCEPGTGEGKWHIASRPVEACEGSDACLVLTEWNEYKEIDWVQITSVMRKPAWLFDARAITDTEAAKRAGMKVWKVGAD